VLVFQIAAGGERTVFHAGEPGLVERGTQFLRCQGRGVEHGEFGGQSFFQAVRDAPDGEAARRVWASAHPDELADVPVEKLRVLERRRQRAVHDDIWQPGITGDGGRGHRIASAGPARGLLRPQKPIQFQILTLHRMGLDDFIQHGAGGITPVPAMDRGVPAGFVRRGIPDQFPRGSQEHLVAGAGDESQLRLVMIPLLPVEAHADEMTGEPRMNLWFGKHPALLKSEAGSVNAAAVVLLQLCISAAVRNQRVAHEKERASGGLTHFQRLLQGRHPKKFVRAAHHRLFRGSQRTAQEHDGKDSEGRKFS